MFIVPEFPAFGCGAAVYVSVAVFSLHSTQLAAAGDGNVTWITITSPMLYALGLSVPAFKSTPALDPLRTV